MLWFSVGRKDDFDNCTDVEEVNTIATRFAPNVCISVNAPLVKIFDKGYSDLYASFDMYQARNDDSRQGIILGFVDSTDAVVACLRIVRNNTFVYGAILEINGKQLDITYGFPISFDVLNQIEMHITCNGANSAVQVYLNGDLVISYSGNITSNKLTALRFDPNLGIQYFGSNFVITDEGRIGKKYPILLPLTSVGEKNDYSYYTFVDNVPAAVNSILALKLNIKSLASVNLQNGEWLINIAGKEVSNNLSLPNTIQQKDVMIEGSWLTSDINSAQVGFRART